MQTAAVILFGLAYLFWAVRSQAGISLRTQVDALALIAAALYAAVQCALLAWKSQPTRLRLSWGLFAAAALALAAEGTRSLLQINGQSLDIALRDPLRIGALAALAAGLLVHPHLLNTRLSPLILFLDVFVTAVAASALTWMTILEPAQAALQVFPLALSYPAVGIVLLLILLLLFQSSDPRILPIPPIWTGIALLVFALAAFSQPLLITLSNPLAGRFSVFLWLAGCLLLAVAALWRPGLSFPFLRHGSGVTGRLARIQRWAPLLLTLALALYILESLLFLDRIRPSAIWVVILLAIAIITRGIIQSGQVRSEQYASLVDSIAEPAFVCDENGILQLVNPAMLGITGFPATADLVGQSLALIIGAPAGVEQLVTHALARRPDQNDTRPIGWSGETLLRRKDGASVPVYLALRPIHALPELGEPHPVRMALAGTAHELTRQKRQQAALQQAFEQVAAARSQLERLNADLEQKVAEETANLQAANLKLETQNEQLQRLDQMKSDFVSLVSHELRAPLTNINGGIELLLSRHSSSEPGLRRNLELVQAEIQRLTRFVETILDISALDAGRMPLYIGPITFEGLITTLQSQLIHRAGVERLHWQAPPDLPPLLGDKLALTSILFHLVDNAMKYAPQGEITVSASAENGQVCIRVSDQGPGIPPADLPLLFDRFYRSDNADSHTVYGHGLGLYIVSRMVTAMGGQIEAANDPAGGAVFTCCLKAANKIEVNHAR